MQVAVDHLVLVMGCVQLLLLSLWDTTGEQTSMCLFAMHSGSVTHTITNQSLSQSRVSYTWLSPQAHGAPILPLGLGETWRN